ncbi:MAG: class I SAM-dependent methyltransferase [Gammaproteobacteria bacterium]|nr:class I SAM-dependent methyltransferase [Gammaproteobacteria bacterium]
MPWWMKIAAKLVLSRIPLENQTFAKLGMFRHGAMQDSSYALEVFKTHFERSEFPGKYDGYTCLELGVGDSVASALIARSFGSKKTYLLDSGRYAIDDVSVYKKIVQSWQEKKLEIRGLDNIASFEELLGVVKCEYLTEGLSSLRTIPDNSVNYVWSQAVLEHIRIGEFDETLAELFRITTPGAVLSHRVDYKDHLGGALDNHRIPSRVWEADWMAGSGFYTNRISQPDMIRRFEDAGFTVEVLITNKWDDLPTPKRKMASEYSKMPDEELLVSGSDFLLIR